VVTDVSLVVSCGSSHSLGICAIPQRVDKIIVVSWAQEKGSIKSVD